MAEAGAAPAPGVVLGGRYTLEERVATGGMASVWRAYDEVLGRPVAVKILSEALADDPAYVERLEREARVAAGLTHPGIVRVFDFGAESERPYIVMEYVEGTTLARAIAGDAPMPDGERLAVELLSALDHVHRAGVVHRDVKPSNVMVGPGGGIRLADLGIAQPREASRITQTGDVIGTLRYMAPEVREGGPATERSDLYSAGILLREASGPARGTALDRVIDALTAPDPAGRPASAGAALNELDRGSDRVAPVSAGHREIELTPRRALAALGILVVAGVLAAVALAGGGGDGRHLRESAHATQRPSAARTATTTTTTVTAAASAPTPACADLEARRRALDERRKRVEHALAGDKSALEGVKAHYEERRHALDERLKACAKPPPAPPAPPPDEGD